MLTPLDALGKPSYLRLSGRERYGGRTDRTISYVEFMFMRPSRSDPEITINHDNVKEEAMGQNKSDNNWNGPLRYDANDPFGEDHPVHILDDIRVKPGCRDKVQALLYSDYIPLATERGVELAGLWLFPPFEQTDVPADIVCMWEASSLKRWWGIRGNADIEGRLNAFWQKLEPYILSRSQRLGRPPEMITDVDADRTDIATSKLPISGARRIAIVKPAHELTESDRADWIAAAAAFGQQPGVQTSEGGFHTALSFLPGQMTWDVVATSGAEVSEDRLLAQLPGPAQISQYVTLGAPLDLGIRRPVGPVAMKRTVLLRVRDHDGDEAHGALEKSLGELARRIEGIRAWSVSKVIARRGEVAWTHCFEQEFSEEGWLPAPYFNNPYHWAVTDRFFAPEAPELIVEEFLHTMRPATASYLSKIGEFEAVDRG